MTSKGFTENTNNIETPNDIDVTEKPLNSNKLNSGRVDINVLRLKLEAQQGKELRKNIFVPNAKHFKHVNTPRTYTKNF